jgi:cytidyltransferase-like protein
MSIADTETISNNIFWNKWYYNFLAGLFIIIYTFLDALDGKHARNTNTSSPLGELVDHYCDCITTVLLTLTICNFYKITDNNKLWIAVLSLQFTFLKEHVAALYGSQTIYFGKYNGPVEAIVGIILLIWFAPIIMLYNGSIIIYNLCIIYSTIQFLQIIQMMVINAYRTNNYVTLFGFAVCVFAQFIKSFSPNFQEHYLENGIIMSTLCGDIILSKMANRDLHQLIPVIHLLTCLRYELSIPLALIYFVLNVWDISNYLNVPILNPTINVFACGYYDGFHAGHKESLRQAAKKGTNLFVGIHPQEELLKKTAAKDQEPKCKNEIMRYEAVKEFKCVTKIIPGCSPYELTKDFIISNKIHVVIISDEYIKLKNDNAELYPTIPYKIITDFDEFVQITSHSEQCCGSNDHVIYILSYYVIAYELKLLQIVPRTQGISSTELRV